MAIPDYQTVMLPLLRLAEDKKEHSMRKAVDKLAHEFKLSEEERKELISSGKEVFDNRVGWAKTYLKKAGLLEITKWGYFCITERGMELLKMNPKSVDANLLYKYPEFKEFKSQGLGKKPLIKE